MTCPTAPLVAGSSPSAALDLLRHDLRGRVTRTAPDIASAPSGVALGTRRLSDHASVLWAQASVRSASDSVRSDAHVRFGLGDVLRRVREIHRYLSRRDPEVCRRAASQGCFRSSGLSHTSPPVTSLTFAVR